MKVPEHVFWVFVWSLCQLNLVAAQTIGFTIYPQQVVTGTSYTVAWDSDGQSATIDLLRNGRREDILFTSDGSASTFQWQVHDDYSSGTDYTLQLTSGSTMVAAPVSVIEDEDGLVVSGSTILTPSPTTLVTFATAISSVGASTTNKASMSASRSSNTATTGTSTTNTAPSTSTNTTASENVDRGPSAGAIVGTVIAVLTLVAIVVTGFIFWRRRKSSGTSANPDPIASLLTLGRRGGATGRTEKGTSPEMSKDDQMAMINEQDDGYEEELLPGRAELHGDSHIPWNELEEGPHPSVINGTFEADGQPMMYELSANNTRR